MTMPQGRGPTKIAIIFLGVGLAAGTSLGLWLRSDFDKSQLVMEQVSSVTKLPMSPGLKWEDVHFKWDLLQSTNWLTYLENLRAFGCPENTVADIIRGEILFEYQRRVNEFFNPLAQFWQSPAEKSAVDRKVREIRGERDMILASLGLSERRSLDAPVSLPPEKQAHVAEALRRYPRQSVGIAPSKEDAAELIRHRQARIAFLSQFLSDEELLNYRIQNDGTAYAIGRMLQSLSPTDAEFREVFKKLDGVELNGTNGVFDPQVESALRDALGSERYNELHENQTPRNAVFNSFISAYNISDEARATLKDLRTTYGIQEGAKDDTNYRAAVGAALKNDLAFRHYFQDPQIYRYLKNQ